MRTSLKTIFLILSILHCVNSRKFEYLIDPDEGDDCLLKSDPEVMGKCKKIIACPNEFERYRHNKTILKICKFSKRTEENIICCPEAAPRVQSHKLNNEKLTAHESNDIGDLFNFEKCRDRYVSLRKKYRSAADLSIAITWRNKKITDDDCTNINMYGRNRFLESESINECVDGVVFKRVFEIAGSATRDGDWQNMAALGWIQNNKIQYKCGGVVITERFVLSAAHCRYQGKSPDVIHVGSKYLENHQSDDYRQLLKIEKFIPHPNYKSIEAYNDIALIKTVEKIVFNEFVLPPCIIDIETKLYYYRELKIAGFGQTDESSDSSSDILLEIHVNEVSSEECNKSYEDITRVPKGILSSQVCTIGVFVPFAATIPMPIDLKNYDGRIPDTCYGDSGGPVQYKIPYDIKDKDYNETFMKTIYEIPITVGLVSFGIGCGLKIPSVNTRIINYREWIQTVINEN